ISVVNALSKRVEVNVRRDGQVYNIERKHGFRFQTQHIRQRQISQRSSLQEAYGCMLRKDDPQFNNAAGELCGRYA
ncbi:hypothetical protein O5472_27135, partial [Escherichia coli]|nr:hypothetical protein [Escherichia coli]